MEYEEECIPTLAGAFSLLAAQPAILYVELKTDRAPSTEDLVKAVTETIVDYNFQKRVVVVSFDHTALLRAKSLNPSIRTGALFEPRRQPGLSWRADIMLKATRDCGADEILPHRLLARPKLIDQALSQDFPVVVWTVEDASWLSRAKRLGIYAVMTNNPNILCPR